MRPLFLLLALACVAPAADIDTRVEQGYADSSGVKIHYASLGKGPLIVLIHGLPDFWYTWRNQMAELSSQFQTAAIDMRGYNLSDKPKGVDNYAMRRGGLAFAINVPQMTDRLIILNLPHQRGLCRELANNPQQRKNSHYARNFQQEDAPLKLTAEGLSAWVKDPQAKQKYIEAFHRSDFEAMLNYYKMNIHSIRRRGYFAAGEGESSRPHDPRTERHCITSRRSQQ
jgi:epoxide hydrolase 4